MHFSVSKSIARIIAAAGIAGMAIMASGASAQDYPDHEVTMLVGFNAGGATDVIARALADQMEKALGQPVVVVNKSGAGGLLALNEVARAKPDGYTLMLSTATPLTASRSEPEAPTVDDVEVIGIVNLDGSAVLVKADSEFKTLDAFFEAAKDKPNSVVMAHAGVGGSYYLNALVWEATTGAKFKYVPYGGGSEIYPALAGGHVESASAVLSPAKQLIGSGQIRALGVSSAERNPSFPDVPTFKESGIDLVWGAPKFVIAPKDTPEDVIAVLSDALDQAMNSEEMNEFWAKTGYEKFYLKRDEATQYLQNAQKSINEAFANADGK
ncbi:MAG: recombinase RecA [Rhizobiaceae bacterium MnEN-MB40S]|nr:MAG: recombinase RecA [Rhizobiaceae bacterium MnEN-MB40S]